MKAARFYAPGDLRIEEVPDPVPAKGDVLVQVEVALSNAMGLGGHNGCVLLGRAQ